MKRKQRISMSDIASYAGVSQTTVSRVLNQSSKVSPSTCEKVLEAAESLGYVRHLGAASMASSKVTTLGLLIRDARNSFYGGIASNVQHEAERLGYDLLITAGGDRLESQMRAVSNLLGHDVGGIIIASGRIAVEVIEYSTTHVPTVALSSGVELPLLNSVRIDPRWETELARQVVARGHRHVAVTASSSPLASTLHARTANFLTELIVAGVSTEILKLPFDTGQHLKDEVDRCIELGVTAIMAGGDTIALAILEHLHKIGVPCPEKISVTGFDGVGALASPLIGLTTVRQPVWTLAQKATELVTKIIESQDDDIPPRRLMVDGKFIPGRTLAGPRHAKCQ